MSFLCGCVNSIYRAAACSSRSHGDAWQERTCCSQAPATTEVLKLNTYMGMTGRPFVCAPLFQITEKRSKMKLIIDSKRQGTNYREKIDNVSL